MFRFAPLFIALMLVTTTNWLFNQFGEYLSLEQILFHISTGFEGLEGSDQSIFVGFFFETFAFSFAVTALILIFPVVIRWLERRFERKVSAIVEIYKKISNNQYLVLSLVMIVSISWPLYRFKIASFIYSFNSKDTFSDHYFDLKLDTLNNPKEKKNLILLYVESLETQLRDVNLRGSNLIQPIDDLPGYNISTFAQAPGASWSLAGMVASQCGIPLKLFYGNRLRVRSSMLPNLTCLGDILSLYGYNQYYLVGPNLKFAGIDRFYKSHGYQHAIGRDEWHDLKLDPALFTGWGGGLHDDTVLDEAKKILVEIKTLKKPFNLTIETADSHVPNGFSSPRCTDSERKSGIDGAFACTSKFVAKFIQDLHSENLLENTIVVIMGDHQYMNSKKESHLFPEPRNIYIKIWDSDQPDSSMPNRYRDKMTHFDVAPTILSLMGFLSPYNGRLGLGYSIFSEVPDDEYDAQFEAVMHPYILNRSEKYDSFWF